MANTATKTENGSAVVQTHQAQPMVPIAQSNAAMTIGTDAYRGALEPTNLAEAFNLAELMAQVGYCGVKSPAEALGRIMTGRGLGLSTMQSMRGVYTVNGRPGIDAALMQALCLQSPLCEHFRYVPEKSVPGKKATFVAKRKGDPELEHSFTIEQAIQMGLVDRGDDEDAKKSNNWNKGPDGMLRARARSELARILFPDIVFGMYSREELQGGFAVVDGLRDPNEIAAEILDKEEASLEEEKGNVHVVQKVPRDYAREAEALKAELTAAGTSRAKRAEWRKKFETWDGVEPYRAQVQAFYNDSRITAQTSAGAAPVQQTTPTPTPVGDANLFTGTSGLEEAK